MKKIIISLIAALLLLSGAKLHAQMTYTIDTLKKKPGSNALIINAGVFADFDYNGAGSGYYGAYAHGRYKIGRFLQVGGTAAIPVTAAPVDKPDLKYLVLEGQAAFFFYDKLSTENHKFKLGHGREGGQEYNYSATLPVPQSMQLGVCGSVFNWTRPIMRGSKDSMIFESTNTATGNPHYQDGIYTNVNVTGFAAGLALSTNAKVKYRFNTYHNGHERKKIRRLNSSADVALEMLYAPAIRFRDNVDAGSGASRANYSISNLEKKHMGFRVRADIHRSIFSVRFEMGMRPGVNYFPGGDTGGKKFLKGAYYLIGLGFGIGAL